MGLRGPPRADGPAGAAGPPGPVGPPGPAGGQGSPDTPQQILQKLRTVDGEASGLDADSLDGRHANEFVSSPEDVLERLRGVDGAGSNLDADLLDGLDTSAFMRTDQNTGTIGSLNILGATRLTTLEAGQSRFTNLGQIAVTIVGDLVLNGDFRMGGGQATGVGAMAFAGASGELSWAGTQARIRGRADGGNADGALRLVNDNGVTIETTARITGDVSLGLDRVAGRTLWTLNRQVVSDDGRWTGSSVGLDADTLDGFDSTDFLRQGDLDGLDIGGGGLDNVSVITPGGDPVSFTWTKTGLTTSQTGRIQTSMFKLNRGDIRLRNTGGQSEAIGETGTLNLDHEWVTVQFQSEFTDPVVVATSATFNGGDGLSVRIRNITPQSFEVRLHEWDCSDGPHTTETLGWIAIERGHWRLKMVFKSRRTKYAPISAGMQTAGSKCFFKNALTKRRFWYRRSILEWRQLSRYMAP